MKSIKEILKNVFEIIIGIWEEEIIKKGQELTTFYAL